MPSPAHPETGPDTWDIVHVESPGYELYLAASVRLHERDGDPIPCAEDALMRDLAAESAQPGDAHKSGGGGAHSGRWPVGRARLLGTHTTIEESALLIQRLVEWQGSSCMPHTLRWQASRRSND